MAVVGASGAGKSTLAAIIAGLLRASAGSSVLHDARASVDAHRLSQPRACDQILVMDDGRVAEHGTHAGPVTRARVGGEQALS